MCGEKPAGVTLTRPVGGYFKIVLTRDLAVDTHTLAFSAYMSTEKTQFDEKKLPMLAFIALRNCPRPLRRVELSKACNTSRQITYYWLEGKRGISAMSSKLLTQAVATMQTLDYQKPHTLRLESGELVYHIRSERDEVLLSFDRDEQMFRLAHRNGHCAYQYPATLTVGIALVDLSLALLYGS